MAQVHRVRREEAWTVLHTPAMARVGVATLLGLVTGWVSLGWMRWQFAVLVGWDTIALTVLLAVWPLIVTFDCERTAALSTRGVSRRISSGMMASGMSQVLDQMRPAM